MENSYSASQMVESKPLEEIKHWEHPPWYVFQFEERVNKIFLENQKGLHLHHLTTHFRMPVKRWMIFEPCRETSYAAITLNPESSFTRREKNHSLFHWNTLTYPELLIRIWMSSKRSASMIIGISMGFETCRIHGQVSHNFLYWKKNLLMDVCGPLGGDTRENSWHPGQIIYDQNPGKKAKASHEKPHLDKAPKLLGIYSSTVRTWSSRNSLRMQEQKLGTQMAPAMRCKTCKKNKHVETRSKTDDFKSKLACILEAGESTRLRMGESLPIHHEDQIAGRGNNSLQHLILVHKFIPMPQAMKTPAAKSSSG